MKSPLFMWTEFNDHDDIPQDYSGWEEFSVTLKILEIYMNICIIF